MQECYSPRLLYLSSKLVVVPNGSRAASPAQVPCPRMLLCALRVMHSWSEPTQGSAQLLFNTHFYFDCLVFFMFILCKLASKPISINMSGKEEKEVSSGSFEVHENRS